MKIVFFGASRFVIPVIVLLTKKFDLVLVVTTEKKVTDPVPAYCLTNDIPYLSVSKFDDVVKAGLKNIHASVAVLASFGIILPMEVLTLFPKGILNVHPSVLPLYRGPTPVQSALLNGDAETGVSIIKLDVEMDHGGILGQEKVVISETDTAESLMDMLFRKGANMLVRIIPDYVSGKLEFVEQDHSKATFTKRLLTREDGFIDSDNPPSKEQMQRMIRAYYPWPGVWSKIRIKNQELRIKFLPGNKIQAEGGKPMSIKDFLNGYPQVKKFIENLYG